MRDCPNVTIREQLPALLHGQLSADARTAVERHVAGCADCAAELALLRTVRDAMTTPRVDVERIAAAIPPYVARGSARSVRPFARYAVPIAAALVLAVGLAALWRSNRHLAIDRSSPVASARLADSTGAMRAPAAAPVAPGAPVGVAAVAQLPVGDPLSDLSDGDLRALAESVDRLDAMPSADIEPIEPSFIDMEGDS